MADEISMEHRFHFDLAGFLILRNVLTSEVCDAFLGVLSRLESQTYDDVWQTTLKSGRGKNPNPTRDDRRDCQIRMNGLPRLNPIFDRLIDHPSILPYLKEFVGEPQLVNTWSISKFKGAQQAGWHRGAPVVDYSYRNGDIRSRMLNVVYFLTDNGPEDGCIVAIPGSHKSNFDLKWQGYQGLNMPGSVAVTGKKGDVFLFSETVIHNGLPKTTDGVRSNLYFNYAHAQFNPVNKDPRNTHQKYFPPDMRARFSPTQKELTAWMDMVRWDF